jgi:hypothetical protein
MQRMTINHKRSFAICREQAGEKVFVRTRYHHSSRTYLKNRKYKCCQLHVDALEIAKDAQPHESGRHGAEIAQTRIVRRP